MLVLRRKLGEQVAIGPNLVPTITDVRGGQVQLGIKAPDHVSILRGELVESPEVTAFRRQWMETERG